MTLGHVEAAPAQDVQSAAADLAHGVDFRVRVSAALLLGKERPEGARQMLEKALDDGHPAVRAAAAAALSALGDSAAVGSLERHAQHEASGAARAQMQASITSLQRGASSPVHQNTSSVRARYVVQLGAMRNSTGVRGPELARVLHDAARAQAESLPGAVVYDAGDPEAERAAKRMPVLLLDGAITRMATNPSSGAMRIEARVEFSVRRVPQQTLKGTLSGGATAVESQRTLTPGRLLELQNATVGGAVESAMRGAESGLAMAAK
jgi:hypothetical protein